MNETLKKSPEISRENIEKCIPEIVDVLNKSYTEQGRNTFIGDQSLEKTNGLVHQIMPILRKNGINIPENNKSIHSLFGKYGYRFIISSIQVGEDRYVLNHPLYRVQSAGTFDMSIINFPQSNLPRIRKGLSIHEVTETLVADNRQGVTGYILDGLTIADPITNESEVMLFPEQIKKNATSQNISYQDYRKLVAINEVSQVYFLKIIPTKFLPLKLEDIGIPAPRGTTLHQVLEAFSDLCSLKFVNGGKEEMLRILGSKLPNYLLSKLILQAHAKAYFPMMTDQGIINKITSMSPEDEKRFKKEIVDGYEYEILPLLIKLGPIIKDMSKK